MSKGLSIWKSIGKDKIYEHYRQGKNSKVLRDWVDKAYTYQGLHEYLDKDYLHALRNVDFYARLWELELAEWLQKTGLKMVPTKGSGFDFCLVLTNKRKVWIEAVLSRPNDELNEFGKQMLASNGALYNTPKDKIALRYSSNLVEKAEKKIRDKYLKLPDVAKDDYVLIAVSGFPPAPTFHTGRDIFEYAILPIGFQLVHFPTDGKPLDPTIELPSHEVQRQIEKKPGVYVDKEFIFPGDRFSYIDAVLFSECSNLQTLLGTCSNTFGQDTDTPHIYRNYSGKKPLPREFTKFFYLHDWNPLSVQNQLIVTEPQVNLSEGNL